MDPLADRRHSELDDLLLGQAASERRLATCSNIAAQDFQRQYIRLQLPAEHGSMPYELRLGSAHRMGQEKGVATPVISTCLRALTVPAACNEVC